MMNHGMSEIKSFHTSPGLESNHCNVLLHVINYPQFLPQLVFAKVQRKCLYHRAYSTQVLYQSGMVNIPLCKAYQTF